MGSSPDTCLCGIDVDKAAHMIAVKSFVLAIISGAALIVQICLFNKEVNFWLKSLFDQFRTMKNIMLGTLHFGIFIVISIIIGY
jgi:hypothetical protein